MKSNSKILVLVLFCYFIFLQNKIFSDEIVFDTLELNIINKGNIINAGPGSAYSKNDNITINAQSFRYDKTSSILNATNGFATLTKKKIKIKADKFIYYKKLSTFKALGNVEINDLTNNITIRTDDAIYEKEKKMIKSSVKSTFVDSLGNSFITEDFSYSLSDSLMKISNAKIINIENNIFYIEKAYVNLLTNKLIGKDVSIDFNNDFNKDSKPRLKGKTISSHEGKTIIKKGIFTTCKKNDDCPPWQFLAKEITHDKKKKTINYENAWLKIYDTPVFYFPKFFHPDPTVKRQSGFLMPSFIGSNLTGSAFALPYFHLISNNKDLTFSPRFYSTNKILTQAEYRVINAKSKYTIDTSLLNESGLASKNHFFSNSFKEINFKNFNNATLSLQLQHVSSDTYLKKYKLESPLLNSDASTLTSSVSFSGFRDDLSIETEFVAYENLTKLNDSDKYEYIYPSYNIRKDLGTDLQKIGNFNLNSSGYVKNYNTNIFEKVMINDFLFSSYLNFTDNGLKNNYNILIKNINTDSKNSEKYKEKLDTKIAALIEYNASLPLEKKTDNYTNLIKPVISARYSPNNSKDTKDNNRRIDVNNIFDLNRIGSNESVEGGGSLTGMSSWQKLQMYLK
jgi:LPS-assembly protein